MNTYDAEHRRLRASWTPHVDAGTVVCWRCGQQIQPGTTWDLGHRPDAPQHPEHANQCNRAAAGRHRPSQKRKRPQSRHPADA